MTAPKFENVRPMLRPVGAPAPAPTLAEHTSWLDDDLQRRAAGIEAVHENGPPQVRLCSTGMESLDALIGGLVPGQSYVVAGKTGAGKTSFATHITLALAAQGAAFGHPPVLYFSLEMTAADMADRALAWITGIPQDRVQLASYRRELSDEEVQQVTLAHRQVTQRFRLVATTDASTTAIRAAARHAKATHGLSAVVVDHIGLVEAEKGQERGATREREVAYASRGLRALAMELDVPVIVLCQLARRADKAPEPHLSMLRESGAVENDAGTVLFLWTSKDTPGKTRVVVAKRRFGPPWVETTLAFDGATGRFADLEAGEGVL